MTKPKIGLITTGGTIASQVSGCSVKLGGQGSEAGDFVVDAVEQIASAVILSPVNKPSEEFMIEDWFLILGAIKKLCNEDVQGIVIAHGTDTMAFTIAAVTSCRHMWSKPVCFTGAVRPVGHPSSDGLRNLMGAVELMSDQPPLGIYFSYGAHRGGPATVGRAENMLPMRYDSQDLLFNYDDLLAAPDSLPSYRALDFSCHSASLSRNAVSLIYVYPNMNEDALALSCKMMDIVVFQAYHSGTAPSFFANVAARCKGVTFILGSLPSRFVETPYASTQRLKEAGVYVAQDISAHFLYVFLALGMATGKSVEDIMDKMFPR